jgi:hypothetical protein
LRSGAGKTRIGLPFSQPSVRGGGSNRTSALERLELQRETPYSGPINRRLSPCCGRSQAENMEIIAVEPPFVQTPLICLEGFFFNP